MNDNDGQRPTVLTFDVGPLCDMVAAAGFRVLPWTYPDADPAAVLAAAAQVDGVVAIGPRPLPDGFLDASPRLKVIACLGAGYESYDPADLRRRGVQLTNGGGTNADDVAELAMGLYIAAERGVVRGDAGVRLGHWPQPSIFSRRIRGCKLGIIGLGAIGQALAVRARGFGMEVSWWGPRPKDSPYPRFDDSMALARWADVLAVCARPTPENAGMVDAAMLDALGAQGVLINVARGSLVDEDALIAALKAGRIAAAGLDVFAEEPTVPARWQGVPNTVLTPHLGGATREAIADAYALAVENLTRVFSGRPVINPLN